MRTGTTLAAVFAAIGFCSPYAAAEGEPPHEVNRYIYSQRRAPEFRMETERKDGIVFTRTIYGKQSTYQANAYCSRKESTGELQSIGTFPGGKNRRYFFRDGRVEIEWENGERSSHAVKEEANAELFESICAFVASRRTSSHILYIFQTGSGFVTQGFWMRRGEETTVALDAGNFRCAKVGLSLDPPMGWFFSLDFLVSLEGEYPFIVSGSTRSGGDFRLVRVE